jgi:hypothetical protein
MKSILEAFLKKIFLVAASIFLVWQSYKLLGNLHLVETLHYNVSTVLLLFFIAWILNMFITGIFAFAGFALPTQKLMPSRYYAIRQPRKLKRIYKKLRVEWFRKALLATLWKSQKQRDKYFNGRLDGMAHLEEQSKKSEFGHLIPFILLNLIGCYLIFLGLFVLAFFTLLLNFVGNFYPILLQRHHRMRIDIIKRRFL